MALSRAGLNKSISFHIPEKLRDKALYNAKKRESLHKFHISSRPLSDNYEYIGMLGECAVSLLLGLEVDWELRASGDKGKDFIYKGYILDVKTARKPYNIIREINKPHGDILILAGINEKLDTVDLMGWEFDEIIQKAPYKDFGYGIINHYIPVDKLQEINKLKYIK